MLKQPIKIIGCKAKNEDVLMESQSGGAFALLAEHFLERGAVVYGCGMDESNEAVYKRIEHTTDLKDIKGSKYVQARLNDTFSHVLEDIKSGKTVLFSGTPCYIDAVQNIVKKSPDAKHLFTVDLICHGVPSPKVYKEYKKYLEEKYDSKIMKFIFRDKNGGWHKHVEKVIFENGKEVFTEGYTQLFYTNHPLRPSCGSCRFAGMKRAGDFTVGDFWGVDKSYPDLHDDRGVSLLFCNTERAVEIFEEVKFKLEYIETDVEHAATQPNLKGTSVIPSDNQKFWSDFHKKGIKYCIDNWCPAGIPYRMRRKLRYLAKKVFRVNVRQLP